MDEDEDEDDDEDDEENIHMAAMSSFFLQGTSAPTATARFGSGYGGPSFASPLLPPLNQPVGHVNMPRLQLMINGHVLPSNMTIYQAIKQFGCDMPPAAVTSNGETLMETNEVNAAAAAATNTTAALMSNSNAIWSKVHLIEYKLADPVVVIPPPASALTTSSKRSTRKDGGGETESEESENEELVFKQSNNLSLDMANTVFFESLMANRAKYTSVAHSSINDKSMETITILGMLNEINRNWQLAYSALYNTANNQNSGTSTSSSNLIPQGEFVCAKLAAKANRQLHDPLVIMTGHLPAWLPALMRSSPFLFPFETRLLYFFQSRLDRDRALQKLIDLVPDLNAHTPSDSANASSSMMSSMTGSDRLVPKLDRRKRTVSRQGDLIKQCDLILNEFATSASSSGSTTASYYSSTSHYKPPLLEIQYENEVGTGLGPTLEFYSLLSLEVQRCEHEMWRGERVKLATALGMNGQQEHLFFAPSGGAGLFPAPRPVSVSKANSKSHAALLVKLKMKFKFLGKFMAKALMDNRVLDIALSLPFYKWMLDPATLCEQDLRHVDVDLHRSVEHLRDIARKRRHLLLSLSLSATTNNQQLDKKDELKQLEREVTEMDLDFTLPGFSTIELKKGGRDITVTLGSLDEYLRLIVEWTLVRGVREQMEAFKEGFDSVLSIEGLRQFYPEEVCYII